MEKGLSTGEMNKVMRAVHGQCLYENWQIGCKE